MTEDDKKYIDEMTYHLMLRHNRFDSLGSNLFIGETGKYFFESMIKKRKEIGDAEHVRISKEIGWG